jgi:hypothetical protein
MYARARTHFPLQEREAPEKDAVLLLKLKRKSAIQNLSTNDESLGNPDLTIRVGKTDLDAEAIYLNDLGFYEARVFTTVMGEVSLERQSEAHFLVCVLGSK